MVPATRKQWRTFEEIAEALSGEMDPEWERDRDLIDQSIVDPWERR